MTDTPKLGLTYLQGSQAQKHVTVNDALRRLDGVVQAAAITRGTNNPPASPATGDAYIVPAVAYGLWAGHGTELAIWHDTAWFFYVPAAGWIIYIADEDDYYKFDGTKWTAFSGSGTASGGNTATRAKEELVNVTGAFTETTITFPNRSFVLGASVFVETAITGAASYNCGRSGDYSAFGGSLGIAAGSNNVGVVGGFAVYSDTVVRLTANGGNFTGGAVKVVLHYIELTGPS